QACLRLVILHQCPTLEEHTGGAANLQALVDSASHDRIGEFAHRPSLTIALIERGSQVLSPHELMRMRKLLGHRQTCVDASPRLIWIAQIPQDMAAVEQAGQFWMRD